MWLILIFFALLAGGGGLRSVHCSAQDVPPREIVVLVEETANTRFASHVYEHDFRSVYASLQEGAAKLFAKYEGRSDRLLFHIYRFDQTGTLQSELIASRSGDAFLATLQQMESNPMVSTCWSSCCCSAFYYPILRQVIDQHRGAVIFSINDCLSYLDETSRLSLASYIRDAGSELFLLRQSDSYCGALTYDMRSLALTEYSFSMKTTNIGSLFHALVLFHRAAYQGGATKTSCKNESIRFYVGDVFQAVSLIFHTGKLNRPAVVLDPNGNVYDTNVDTLVDTTSGPFVLNLHAGCPTSWTFTRGYCVKSQSLPTTWDKADAECRRLNATLLTPTDGGDGGLLKLLGQGSDEGWLSLTDTNARKEFRWSLYREFLSLVHVNITTWGVDEPKPSLLGKRCAYLSLLTGRWATSICTALKPYTCARSAYVFENEAPKSYLAAGWWSLKMDSFEGCGFRVYGLL